MARPPAIALDLDEADIADRGNVGLGTVSYEPVLRFAILACGAAACGSPHPREPVHADGPCDLVEAMLSIDDPYYQQMYAGHCGDEQKAPMYVIVHAPPAIFPPDTSCPGRRFRVLHGETDVVDLIPQLDVVPNRDAWRIAVTTVQPNPRETSDGGFDSDETYCAVMSGFVELRDHHWRTFVDRHR